MKQGINARLVMVGDGSERTNVEHRARCLDVFDQCSFVGKQPKIVDYLSLADVLLLPSEQESFGLAALEAMACEVPVIASRVGGIPEVVTDGETGFLSEVGDVDKMANDAARLLADEALRCEMGKRARESAVSRYRTDIVIPQYIDFYNRVLKKRAAEISEMRSQASGVLIIRVSLQTEAGYEYRGGERPDPPNMSTGLSAGDVIAVVGSQHHRSGVQGKGSPTRLPGRGTEVEEPLNGQSAQQCPEALSRASLVRLPLLRFNSPNTEVD